MNEAHGVTIENKKCEFLHDLAPFIFEIAVYYLGSVAVCYRPLNLNVN